MLRLTDEVLTGILNDFGVPGECRGFRELQRYDYADDPTGRSVRLIVRAEAEDGGSFVIRFKNEEDVTLKIVEAQSAFADALRRHGVETPRVLASNGAFARPYRIGGYEVTVTVEEFVPGELKLIDAESAAKTGRLLARMHNIAENSGLHVQNAVLFDPLAEGGNDLFGIYPLTENEAFLRTVDGGLYDAVFAEYEKLRGTLREFENEPRYAVQGDISYCNLFVTPGGEVGVFDFNRSGDNVPFFDAVMQAVFEARLMDYPSDIASDPERAILPAFLAGYDSVRPFTAKQREAFPCFYALITAFWLADLKWNGDSLEAAVKAGDGNAARERMERILGRALSRREMPV